MEKTLPLIQAVRKRLSLLAIFQLLFKISAIASLFALIAILLIKVPLFLNWEFGQERFCSSSVRLQSCCKLALGFSDPVYYLLILVFSFFLGSIGALLTAKKSLRFSAEQAASKVDAALSTKQRVISLLELTQDKGDLPLKEPLSELLSDQLLEPLGQASAAAILPFEMSRSDKLNALITCILGGLFLIFLLISPPLTATLMDENAKALAELIEKNPELPAEVKEIIKELAKKIESKGLNSEATKESLRNAQQSVFEARTSLSSNKDRQGQQKTSKSGDALKNIATPTPTKTPTSTPTTASQASKSEQSSSVDTQHTKASEPQDSDQSKAKQGQAENDSKSPQSGDQAKPDSAQQEDQNNKEPQKDQQGQEEQKKQQANDGKDPQSGADKAKQEAKQNQQGGEGQGDEGQGKEGQQEKQDQSGQGQEDSQQKSENQQGGKQGDQKKPDDDKKQGKEEKSKGQDAENKDSKGKEGQKAGDQKQQSEQALDNAQKALENLKKQSAGGSAKDEKKKTGEKDKEGNKGKEGQDPKTAEGKEQNKEKSKKGELGDSKPDESKKEKEKPADKAGDKGADKTEDKKAAKDDGQTKGQEGQNSGERQSPLDKEAKLKDVAEDQLGKEGAGLGDKAKFKDAEVKSNDSEKLDERFTGEDQGEAEAKDIGVAPKASIQELKLSKPETSKQQRDQPIPLEYEGIL